MANTTAANATGKPVKKRKFSQAAGGKGKGGKGKKGEGGNNKFRKPLTKAQKEMDAKKARLQRRLEKPHGNVIEEAKGLWNKAREKSLEPEKRAALVTQIMTLIDGKIAQVATRHDASRIVQLCISHGTDAQREVISHAVKDKLVTLSKTTYGRFLVSKLFSQSKGKERAMLLKQFQGHMVKLGTHNVSALVIEDLFDKVLSAKQCAFIFQEFYSPEFVHFKRRDQATLPEILRSLAEAGDAKKGATVLAFTLNTVQRMANKGLLSLGFVQYLVWQYLQAAGAEGVKHMLPYVVEVAPALLRTRHGMNSVLECVTLGDAKTRKQVARALKGEIGEWMRHPYGHMVILRLLDITDDTVMIKNTLLKPCVADESELVELLLDVHGSRFVVHLLSPRNPRVFSPLELEFLQEKSTLHAKAAFELQQQQDSSDGDDDLAPVASSRKEPAKRRAELLAFLKVPLVAAVKANLERLATDRHGCHVLEAIVASQWLATDAAFGSALAKVAVSAPPQDEEDEANDEDAGGEGEEGKPQAVAPVLDSQLHASFRRMLKGPGGAPLAEGLLAAMQQVDGGVERFASDPNGAFVLVSAVEAVSTLGSRVLSAVGGAKFFKAKALQENAGAQALSEKLSAQ